MTAYCTAQRSGWLCTLPAGHPGLHVAEGAEELTSSTDPEVLRVLAWRDEPVAAPMTPTR